MSGGHPVGRVLLAAHVAGTAAAVVALNHYVFVLNETNHTGLPLEALAAWLAGNAAVAVGLLAARRANGRGARTLLGILAAVTAIGFTEIIAWDLTGTMTSYDRWLEKGMHDR